MTAVYRPRDLYVYSRDVNETLHDETETSMPRDETRPRHFKKGLETSETIKSRDRDVDRDVLIKSIYKLLAY